MGIESRGRERSLVLACKWNVLVGLVGVLSVACGGAEEPEEQAESTGFLRVPTQEVQAAERTPGSVAGDVGPTDPGPDPSLEQPSAPASESGGSSGAGAVPAARDATDLELASALLHEPYASFAQLIDRRAGQLDQERRQMLLAFSAARAGALEKATEMAAGLEGSEALTSSESRLLGVALESADASSTLDSLALASPLERAMELCLLERRATRALEAGDSARAARAYSALIQAELQSPWVADRPALRRWSQALHQVQEQHRWNPFGEWPSLEVTVQPSDSLIAIRKRTLAQRPDLLLCTGLIARANRLADEGAIRPDDVLRIPTDRASARVHVGARWALFFLGDEVVGSWEVGVGKEQGATRPGTYEIGDKQSEPMWFQPGRAPVPFGDPENPLGTRWMAWDQGGKGTSLGFHGTSDPDGVGGRVSKGCVRMRNEDVEALFEVLPRQATVTVVP